MSTRSLGERVSAIKSTKTVRAVTNPAAPATQFICPGVWRPVLTPIRVLVLDPTANQHEHHERGEKTHADRDRHGAEVFMGVLHAGSERKERSGEGGH
jgi:hypothetical protein